MLDSASKASFAQTTITDLIKSYGRRQASKVAFIEGGNVVDWRSFDNAVSNVATELAEQSIEPGERIGLLAVNSIWAYCVMFGIIRAGGVSTALSTMLSLDILIDLIDDSGMARLYVGKGLEGVAADITTRRPKLKIVIESNAAEFFSVQQESTPYLPIALDRPFSVTYSSGTTASPKGIVHSHLARLWFAYEIGNHFGISANSKCVVTTPPYSNGTNICLLPAIYRGATVILLPKFDAEVFCNIVHRHSPSHTFMVPTQFQALLNSARSTAVDWDCFTALITAGAPMPIVMRQAVLALTGPRLAELWGLTEGVGCSLTVSEMMEHAGAVGRVASGSDIRLIDTDGNEVLEGTGEIVGRSVMLMDGYLNRPEATEAVKWTSPEGLVYLRTGDLGEFDRQGYLWIRGRIKDMIIRGGFNVYPIDIEEVLARFPTIVESAVIGVEDTHWGEVPVAICVVHKDSDIDGADILEQANAQLSKPQRLKDVVIRYEPLPRNALGKVLKNDLRAAYGESVKA